MVAQISMHIDWLALTFPHVRMNPNDALTGFWHYTGKGMHGYRERWVDTVTGATLQMVGTDDMGSHLTLSGDTMAVLRGLWSSEQALVSSLVHNHGRPSRIDLAVDVKGSDISVPEIEQKASIGEITFRAKKRLFVEEKTSNNIVSGQTLYVGGRTSDAFMRIYNKALEQNIVNMNSWVRLEMELKSLMARGATGSVASNGVEPTTRGILGTMMQWPNNDTFKKIMDGELVDAPVSGKKLTNTEQWLLTVVAKTMAKTLTVKPEFWETFRSAVDNEAKILTQTTTSDTLD